MSTLQKFISAVIIILVLTVGYLFVHKNKATAPTESKVTPLTNPASFAGVYKGIDMTLTINPDGTYESQMTYLGKSTKPFVEKGKWGSWDNRDVKKTDGQTVKGTGVALNPDTDTVSVYLRINENELKQLDKDYNEIDSPFNQTLTKKAAQ